MADDAPVLGTVSFSDPSWWRGMLHRGSVLDYFALSQFYDRTCLNQHLKMQVALAPQDVENMLRTLPGIVYQLDEARTEEIPPNGDEPAHTLYVIKKLRRDKKRKETILRFYYVLDGIIYEAPTLAAVMRARLLKLGWHLREAFKCAAPMGMAEGEAEGASSADGRERGGGEVVNTEQQPAAASAPSKRTRQDSTQQGQERADAVKRQK
jgi:hypothetical protein